MQKLTSFTLAVVLLLAGAGLNAADRVSSEAKIKAAFLFQFSQFARWPAEASAHPFTICVAGNTDIYSALQPLERRGGIEREIHVTLYSADTTKLCHIIYLEKRALNAITEAAVSELRPGVLTVSSELDFTRQGGMIELNRKDGKIHILINRHTAAAAGITFSAKLLEVATLVEVP